MAGGLPTVEVTSAELEEGIGVLSAFVRTGLATSNGEARRAVKGGGARVNDTPVTDSRAGLGRDDVREGLIKLSLGKKKHALLKIV